MKNYIDNNIICLDLTKFSEPELKDLMEYNSNFSDVSISTLDDLRVDFILAKRNGYLKMFIDTVNKVVTAYVLNSDSSTIVANYYLINALKDVKSFEVEKVLVESAETSKSTQFTMDMILDKITLSGMGSLNADERKFLNI